MYAHILLPLDGSPAAEEAVPVAAGLARRSGAELELVLVHLRLAISFPDSPEAVDFGDLDAIQLEYEATYLSRVAERLRAEPGLRISTHHLSGPVMQTLAAHIANAAVDLVVMTTHGRGPVGRLWLGSVADGLVRTASVPVLMLRSSDHSGDRRSSFRRVLVPLDQSTLAEHATGAARDLLDQDGDCVLLHVLHPGPLMSAMPAPFGVIPELVADPESRDHAHNYLERIARRLRHIGTRARTAVTVAGNVAVEILDEARRERVDAIVVTTHGVGGLRRLLLGSVVDKLVHGADVPVLVCRPPAGRRAAPARRARAVYRIG